jgi:hypothetical protein
MIVPVWPTLDTHTNASIVKSLDPTSSDAVHNTENPENVVGVESDCEPNFERVALTPAVP